MNKTDNYSESRNTRATGNRYEDWAAEFLSESGYRILARNFRCRYGEIDIVAEADSTLIFVEVKYRKSESAGIPEEAVNIGKQRKICLVSRYYIMKSRNFMDVSVRYDVITINGRKGIRHIVNAFDYID